MDELREINNTTQRRKMDLPRYYIVGLKAVKITATKEGGVGAYAYNPETGQFDLAVRYYDQIFFGKGDDVDSMPESEFIKYIEELKAKRAKK